MRVTSERSMQSHHQRIIFVINEDTLRACKASRPGFEPSGCPVWDAICLLADLYRFENGLPPVRPVTVQEVQVEVFDPPLLPPAQ